MSKPINYKTLSKIENEIKSFVKRKPHGEKHLTLFRRNDGSNIKELHEFIFIKNLLIKSKVVHQRMGGCDLLTKI